jgi:predicted nucleotidyltransferase
MSLFEELIEDREEDERIVKSFQTKDTLCLDIFDKQGESFKMKNEIRKRLIEISDNFIESLGVEFFIHDIILTGSLANFNWSEYSDVDLHILIDMDEVDGKKSTNSNVFHKIMKEFFDSKKNIWNEKHDIKVKGFDVEVYIQDIDEPHVSSGVYSILNNSWIVEPLKNEPKIDDRKILEKGEEFAKKIDKLVSMSDSKDVIPQLEELRKRIKKFRQSGLESGGEYSYENLTFKLLRRNGYIKKLLDLKNQITDKKLSITQ